MTLEEVAGAAVQEAEARMGEAFATQLEVMHARDVAEVEVSCEGGLGKEREESVWLGG